MKTLILSLFSESSYISYENSPDEYIAGIPSVKETLWCLRDAYLETILLKCQPVDSKSFEIFCPLPCPSANTTLPPLSHWRDFRTVYPTGKYTHHVWAVSILAELNPLFVKTPENIILYSISYFSRKWFTRIQYCSPTFEWKMLVAILENTISPSILQIVICIWPSWEPCESLLKERVYTLKHGREGWCLPIKQSCQTGRN